MIFPIFTTLFLSLLPLARISTLSCYKCWSSVWHSSITHYSAGISDVSSGKRGLRIGVTYWSGTYIGSDFKKVLPFYYVMNTVPSYWGLLHATTFLGPTFPAELPPGSELICYLDNFIIDLVLQFRTESDKSTNHIQKCNSRREAFFKTKRYLSHPQNDNNSRY